MYDNFVQVEIYNSSYMSEQKGIKLVLWSAQWAKLNDPKI